MPDADIYQALCKERHYQLQQAACQQAQKDLQQLRLVMAQVREYKAGIPLRLLLLFYIIKSRGRLERQDNTAASINRPALQELSGGIFLHPMRRICHKNLILLYLIDHNEVPLLPVCNTGKWGGLHQVLKCEFKPYRLQAQLLRSLTQRQEAGAHPVRVHHVPQVLQGEAFAIIFTDHPQAGGAAVHLIVLLVKWESPEHSYMNCSLSCMSNLFLSVVFLHPGHL